MEALLFSTAVVALADRLCDGRLVVTLEGGYDLAVLACGVANTCRALLNDPLPGVDGGAGAPPRRCWTPFKFPAGLTLRTGGC